MTRINLGIIQTNHDRTVEIGDAFPDDAHRFRDLFDKQEQRFNYRVYMAIGGEFPSDVDEQDAYLITGSPLSVLDDHFWLPGLLDFVRSCDEAKKPLLGTCFGHQAVALALGGKVENTGNGYNVGVEATQYAVRKPWMQPRADTLPLFVFHEDQVTHLPEGCELLGGSNLCPIGSFSKGNHIFTTQSHPEITERFIRALLDYCETQDDQTDYNAARETLSIEARGDIFAEWATNFFKGEK